MHIVPKLCFKCAPLFLALWRPILLSQGNSLLVFSCLSLTEALWQPARKTTATENRRPIYVFSTDMANAAADAVLKNRYDSIIQFHNAQPKGPGFLRLSKKDPEKRETANMEDDITRDLSDSDGEGGGSGRGGGGGGGGGGGRGGAVRGGNEVNRAQKRRSSRLSTSEENLTTKRLRGGGQAGRVSDSKQIRYSRRLRKRQQASSSPPSSPAKSANQSSSDEEEEESEAESTGTPTRVAMTQRGRGGRRGGRRGRGRGGRGRGRRNTSPVTISSGRRGRAGDVDEKSSEDKEEVEGDESEKQAEDNELDTSGNTDQQETAEGEDDGNNDDHIVEPPGDHYVAEKKAGSPHLTTQQPTQHSQEENNYTICHGTPRSKGGRAAGVSNPAPHNPLSPYHLVSGSPAMGRAPSGTPVSSVSHAPHHTQHDIASLGVLPDKQQSSAGPGLPSGTVTSRGDPMLGATSALHPHSGAAAATHHKDAAMAPNNWPGGLGPHQFAHVPSGYYGAGIHPMSYPPHPAAQHVPGANYSYGVYPWGTPHHPVGGPPREQQQHLYGGHEGSPQHRSSQHPSQQPGGGHFQGLHPAAHRSPTADMGKDSTGVSGASSHGGHETTPTHEKQHPLSSSTHPSLRQLHSSAGVMTTLPHVQHPSAPAFSRSPHPALSAEQISTVHPAFSYGFDPSNPAALSHMHQLWQHQQQQMRAAGAVHPAHLPPHLQHTAAAAAGMWYPHMQQLMQHGGGGGGAHQDDSAKRRAQQSSGAKPHPSSADGLRTNSNRNNNEPALIVRPSPEALLHGTRFPHKKNPLPSFQQALTSLFSERGGSTGEEWSITRPSASHERNAHPHHTDSYPR